MRWHFKILLLLPVASHAQDSGSSTQIMMNEIVMNEQTDYGTLTEQLEYYVEHPINLNKIGELAPPVIDQRIRGCIDRYIDSAGPLASVYELRQIECLTSYEIRILLPYVTVKDPRKSLEQMWSLSGDHQITTTIKGHFPQPATTAQGSLFRRVFRYRYRNGADSKWGLTMESDVGEQGILSSQRLPDHVSGFLEFRPRRLFDRILIGNYHADLGYGVNLSTSGVQRYSSAPLTQRIGTGFTPDRSVRENAGLQGIALVSERQSTAWGIALSHRRVDGRIADDSRSISSIDEDGGYHRTSSEIQKRHAVKEDQLILYAERKKKAHNLGATLSYRRFNRTLIPGSALYQLHSFRGQGYVKCSGYGDLQLKYGHIYGEVGMNLANRSTHGMFGYMFALDHNVSVSGRLIAASPRSDGFQTTAPIFGEYSNQLAVQTSIQYRWKRSSVLLNNTTGRNPWASFTCTAPRVSSTYHIELFYRPKKHTDIRLKVQLAQQEESHQGSRLDQIAMRNTFRIRAQWNHRISDQVELRGRYEHNVSGTTSYSKGSLISHDMIWSLRKQPMQMSCRYSSASIGSYDNRIYQYERVPLYGHPIFNHHYTGERCYVVLRYKLKQLQFWSWLAIDSPSNRIMTYSAPTIETDIFEFRAYNKKSFTLQLKFIL